MSKRCSSCRESKPLVEFHRNRCQKDGRDNNCKVCKSERARNNYKEDNAKFQARNKSWREKPGSMDKIRAQAARWRQCNPEKSRSYGSKWRASVKDSTIIPFTADQLSQRWAYYGNRCYMCGEPATETDHVKPVAKGGAHMLGNLRPSCLPCNRSKSAKWPYAPVFERRVSR